ncbi:ATP-binding cassette sub-family G member 8 [Aplysia californica]|uniref:ATP-binding cassette sub-family G member 8 n=1 Tax=Aplysia californica TaxID=6500 RepID=A0ABM1A793_APLCA|nr:ATP-binding cassette sub-family G member 8 [Aplysia californica]
MPWEWMEPGRTTQILQDVSFTAKSGQLMAVLGGSGSGKTTLLDVLASRTTTGEMSGNVYLNSVAATKDIVDACTGYVRQDDRLISFLTVRESLMFVAQLKLPKSFTHEQIVDRVDRVIQELGLKHVADTKVGNATQRGLSGGERRRVSIGIQLLILPSILLLDEPTSGLDSFTANNIAQTLSRLASKKRTVLMSIHQPRFDIFNIVDVMMILSRGKIVYYGPGKEMISYFTTLGYPCPELTNPCDFYIDLATVDKTTKEREDRTLTTVRCLHEAYRATDNAISAEEISTADVIGSDEMRSYSEAFPGSNKKRHVEGLVVPKNETLKQLLKAHELHRSTSGIFTQFYCLFKRFMRINIDDWTSLLTHMVEAVLMSTLLGTGFYDLKLGQSSVRDWFGLMFMVCVMYPYMILLGLIGRCFEERRFLYFELQDKLYHPSAFYFAKVFSDLPFHLLFLLIYCVPVYGLTGLNIDAYSCFMFYIFVSASVFSSRCIAMMSAALLPTYELASVFAQIIFSLYFMSGGFILNLDNILPETRWLSDLSLMRWSYQALAYIFIEDLTFECDEGAAVSCVRNGAQAMKIYGLDSGELWTCGLVIGLNVLVFLVIMLVGLVWVPQKPHDEDMFTGSRIMERFYRKTFECDEGAAVSCVRNGAQAMKIYGLDSGELWTCGLVIGLNVLVFLVIMLVGLVWVPQKPHDEDMFTGSRIMER